MLLELLVKFSTRQQQPKLNYKMEVKICSLGKSSQGEGVILGENSKHKG